MIEQRLLRVDPSSCREAYGCTESGGKNGFIIVGNDSCVGLSSCQGAGMGNKSGPRTATRIGNESCIGGNSCASLGDSRLCRNDLTAKVFDGSCNGNNSCDFAGGCVSNWKGFHAGVHFEVGYNSCINDQSCLWAGLNGKAIIGNESCVGKFACKFQNASNLGKRIEIGKNSCRCESCCQCLNDGDRVPDNMCNDLGSGTNHCCIQAGIDQFRNSAFNFDSSSPLTSPGSTLIPTSPPTSAATLTPTVLPTSPGSTLIPTSPPTSAATLTPTVLPTVLEISIGKVNPTLVDTGGGNFSILLNYTAAVGHSIERLHVSLRHGNCFTSYVEAGFPVVNLTVPSLDDAFAYSVDILTENFASSNLIINTIPGKGNSTGLLVFCVRAEGYIGDKYVSFRQDVIRLPFYLSSNGFQVADNGITTNEVLRSSKNIITAYKVEACRCSGGFSCDPANVDNPLRQNQIVFICIYPDAESMGSVNIADFKMAFYQDSLMKYQAVSYGLWVNHLSQHSYSEPSQIHRVASRIVSNLFEGDSNNFVVQGNAFLSFRTGRHLRSAQDTDQAGEASFKMGVSFKKGMAIATTRGVYNTNGGDALCAVGGVLVLIIGVILFKKLK